MGQKYVIAYGYATKTPKYMSGMADQRPTYSEDLGAAMLLEDPDLLEMAKRNLISGAMTVYKATVEIKLEMDGVKAGYRRPLKKETVQKKKATLAAKSKR